MRQFIAAGPYGLTLLLTASTALAAPKYDHYVRLTPENRRSATSRRRRRRS